MLGIYIGDIEKPPEMWLGIHTRRGVWFVQHHWILGGFPCSELATKVPVPRIGYLSLKRRCFSFVYSFYPLTQIRRFTNILDNIFQKFELFPFHWFHIIHCQKHTWDLAFSFTQKSYSTATCRSWSPAKTHGTRMACWLTPSFTRAPRVLATLKHLWSMAWKEGNHWSNH